MRDSVNSADSEREIYTAAGAIELALLAIGRLVARKSLGAVLIRDIYLDRLVEASIAPDPRAIGRVLADMRRAVILPERIAEEYIPAAARKLGQDWHDDCLPFAAVSLGSARLGILLRDVAYSDIDDDIGAQSRPSTLVIVPPGEQHTLGAGVLSSQLRRMGHSVSLQLAPTMSELAAAVEAHQFGCAMISISNRNRVDTCAMLVKNLRSMTGAALPIFVGGALLAQEPDLLLSCNADLVTNDLQKALSSLGMPASEPSFHTPPVPGFDLSQNDQMTHGRRN